MSINEDRVNKLIGNVVSSLSGARPRLIWTDLQTVMKSIVSIAEEVEENGKSHVDQFGKAKADLISYLSLAPPNINKTEAKNLRESLKNFLRAVEQVTYEGKGFETEEEGWVEEGNVEEEEEEEGEGLTLNSDKLSEMGAL